ncbi:SGNH hydrolase domain-containing protein [Rugosimonospora acidiphila]|uniref:SGNH hydrolase domain-containing protein n=1 Tax=Rugosimonospora acidiphila TaxID=556531 RepID=A0ABP9SEC7_9ACTN
MARRTDTHFRPDIEGLRAIAILLVVLYHAGLSVVPGGYVGVDIFFVISGFLITTQLIRELSNTGRIAFGRFYARRALRLLPASVMVALATILATWHWAPPLFARTVSADGLAGICYLINVRLAIQGTSYLDATQAVSPLQHFWSLAVEEQFYLIWPAVLALAALAWAKRASLTSAAVTLSVLGGASLVLCVWQTGHSEPWAYFGIQARAWELAAGALVALAADRLARLRPSAAAALSWSGLLLVLCSALIYDDATVFPGYAAVLPVAGAALMIAGGTAAPRFGPILVLRRWFMQEIGRLSYGWYLWHWPVLILAPYVLGRDPGVPLNLALAGAALVPAAMSLTAIEDRIRFHRSLRARPRHGLLLGGGLTATAAVLALLSLSIPVTVKGRGTATNTAHVLAAPSAGTAGPDDAAQLTSLIQTSSYATAMPGNLVPPLTNASHDYPNDGDCLATLGQTSVGPSVERGCELRGDVASPTIVVIFGDSHAHQWFDAINTIALQQHWRLALLAKAGCTPATILVDRTGSAQSYTECQQWRASAIDQINRMRPSLVLLSSLYYGNGATDGEWAQAWLSTVNAIRPSGARSILMDDTPDLRGHSVPDCVSGDPLNIRRCDLPVAQAIHTSRNQAVTGTLTAVGVKVIDPTPWFCTSSVCPVVIGNTLVYRDGSHVSATYIKLLTPLLAPLLEAR